MDTDLSVVYVEDDATSREVMEILLKHVMGLANAVIFENSTDIITKMTSMSARPKLVLLDIHMKPIDGFAILKALRASEDFKDTKVVAVTASVMNEEVELLKEAGFDGGIAKPIRPDSFPGLVDRLLQGEKIWHII